MKTIKSSAFILPALLFLHAQVFANPGFELGVIVGEPTGLSIKQWVSSKGAFDGAAAWSFAGGDFLHIHADYLIHNHRFIKVTRGSLPLYMGLGGVIRIAGAGKAHVGARIPFGMSYLFEGAPLDLFLEIAPIFELAPATQFDMSGGLGLRFTFG
ncbi:MAG: hypothetical protein GF401_17910 [Chitinivibrionales bacterium]|nr:hypothetical protein [Chitinivibrionales bacterium]